MADRRSFLKKSVALAALAMGPGQWLKAGDFSYGRMPGRMLPKRLKEGDRIGLVTPGSPVSLEQLNDCISKLENLGFLTTHNDTVLSEYGYFAGPDRERADELMDMFTRDDVDAIMCVRGGYGSIRILDLLDYGQIQKHPKAFIGYSDITALLAAIYQETGMVTYHGLMGVSDFNKFSVKSFRKVLMDPQESYRYPYKREKETRDNPEYDRYTISGGKAEGVLTGGNISVLDSLIGTRFETDFEGKIVFLEDVEEKTYRVDKMLYHLLTGTNLKKAAGIILGACDECNVGDAPTLALHVALSDLLGPLGIPVSYGLAFGHIKRMLTIPVGIRAAMDADRNSFELLEAAVI